MKIAVYTCMKDEAANAVEWLNSVALADDVVVLDTGSTDSTLTALYDYQARSISPRFNVQLARIEPFRFDVALNCALALVPPDVDVCVQLSADERLSRGWRAGLEAALEAHRAYWHARGAAAEPFKVRYPYQFSPELEFWHDRIHSRHGFAWRYPFHEGLYCVSGEPERSCFAGMVKVTQTQLKQVDRMARDHTLALQARAEHPHDARMCFYVGRQWMYEGRYRDALAELMRYPELSRGSENPGECRWWAEAVAQCWAGIEKGGK